MSNRPYKEQVALLLRIIPVLEKEKVFAMHGGTAINLFIRDMPRLSVDIDLTYVPLEDRETSVRNIGAAVRRVAAELQHVLQNPRIDINERGDKLTCSLDGVQVKVEVNNTARGLIGAPEMRVLCERAQKEFRTFCRIQTAPLGQIYGGKICAALDRQHPRDLFDVKYMLESEGFTLDIKRGFMACLLSSDRPLNEMLRPNFKDERLTMTNHFEGMSNEPFSYAEYEATREKLVKTIHEKLTPDDRAFLLSFKNGEPEWERYGYADLEPFPSIRWKLQNIRKLKQDNPAKHKDQLEALKEKLGT